jgi:hypothetical protein
VLDLRRGFIATRVGIAEGDLRRMPPQAIVPWRKAKFHDRQETRKT